MTNNYLFEEMTDSIKRAFARLMTVADRRNTTAVERVISFITRRNLEANVRWFDDPECTNEFGEKSVEIDVVVAGYHINIRTLHINERLIISIDGITKVPIEIAPTLDDTPDIWYRSISRNELPAEVDKFLCDILEVI
jgi:hypothetical protein